MKFAEKSFDIFNQATEDYHKFDNVDAVIENPYGEGTIEHTLYAKNMVDAVQWHLEDIIRDPEIDPVAALALKRRIDRSNQVRARHGRGARHLFPQQICRCQSAA